MFFIGVLSYLQIEIFWPRSFTSETDSSSDSDRSVTPRVCRWSVVAATVAANGSGMVSVVDEEAEALPPSGGNLLFRTMFSRGGKEWKLTGFADDEAADAAAATASAAASSEIGFCCCGR